MQATMPDSLSPDLITPFDDGGRPAELLGLLPIDEFWGSAVAHAHRSRCNDLVGCFQLLHDLEGLARDVLAIMAFEIFGVTLFWSWVIFCGCHSRRMGTAKILQV